MVKKLMRLMACLMSFVLLVTALPNEVFSIAAQALEETLTTERAVSVEDVTAAAFSEGTLQEDGSGMKTASEEEAKSEVQIVYEKAADTGVSSLSAAELTSLCGDYDIPPADLKQIAAQGYQVNDSIRIGQMAKDYEMSTQSLTTYIKTVGGIDEANAQLAYIEGYTGQLDEAQMQEIKSLMLKGYDAFYLMKALPLCELLNLPLSELIDEQTTKVQFSRANTVSSAEKSTAQQLQNLTATQALAAQFHVKESAITSYMQAESMDEEQLQEEIVAVVAAAPSNVTNYIDQKKYVQAPFAVNPDSETISTDKGTLVYQSNDIYLPGKNGLDLNIGIRYNNQEARNSEAYLTLENVTYGSGTFTGYYLVISRVKQWGYNDGRPGGSSTSTWAMGPFSTSSEASYWSDYYTDSEFSSNQTYWSSMYYLTSVQTDYVYGNVQYFKKTYNSARESYLNKKHLLGTGWMFNFSDIEISGNNKILRLSDGRTLVITEKGFKDYALEDLVFTATGSPYAYTLQYQDGKKECFNSSGNLVLIEDRYGNKIQINYHASLYLSGISSYVGQQIQSIVDSLGRTITFTYNNTGSEVTITLPDNKTVKYIVSGATNGCRTLSKKIDQAGNETLFGYTVGSRATSLFYLSSQIFLPQINLTSITYPTGGSTHYTYEYYINNFGAHSFEQAYRVKTRHDLSENITYSSNTYAYSQAQYYQEIHASMTYWTTKTNSAGKLTRYTYDYRHLNTKIQTEQSSRTLEVIDLTYGTNRLVSSSSQKIYPASGSNFLETTNSYTYDNKGNILTHVDPNSMVTTSTYGQHGIPLTVSFKQDNATTILCRNTLTSDQKSIGITEILANNVLKQKTENLYDSYGNVTQQRQYTGTSQYITTLYDYTDNQSRTAYNGAYLTKITTSGLKKANGSNAASTPGEAAGTVVSRLYYNNMGQVARQIDPSGYETQFLYDTLGNVSQITHPGGALTKYVRNYVANEITVTNENGHATKHTYQDNGLLSSVRDLTQNQLLSSYSYDNLMRLSYSDEYLTSSNFRRTWYTYDVKDRITSQKVYQGASQGTLLYQETYAYDDAVSSAYQKVTKTVSGDAYAPAVTTFEYHDKVGNLIREGYLSLGVEYYTAYAYNYLGQKTSAQTHLDRGRGLTTARWNYDHAGQVTGEYNAANQLVSSTYDMLGNRLSATDYAGSTTT